jgi:hypothetical protein
MLYEPTAVPMFRVFLRGSRRFDLIHFSTVVCLFPDKPKLRILRTDDDTLFMSDAEVGVTVKDLSLIDSACMGQGHYTSGFGHLAPNYIYQSCEQFAAVQGLPVAVIAFGRLHRKLFTALLVVPDAVPAQYVLQRFQEEV